jgi:hypothetical protein
MEIDELKKMINSQDYFLCLHNGFHPFSYGCPNNPIVFNRTDGEILINALYSKYKINLLLDLSLNSLLTIELDRNISKKIGFRLAGIYEKRALIFENKIEEEKSEIIRSNILKYFISKESPDQLLGY